MARDVEDILSLLRAGVEAWLGVPSYEGYYEVSSFGRVKSLARSVPMRDGRTYRVREKVLKLSNNGHYLHAVLSRGGAEETLLVHRLVLETFAGPCPEGMECCHN